MSNSLPLSIDWRPSTNMHTLALHLATIINDAFAAFLFTVLVTLGWLEIRYGRALRRQEAERLARARRALASVGREVERWP